MSVTTSEPGNLPTLYGEVLGDEKRLYLTLNIKGDLAGEVIGPSYQLVLTGRDAEKFHEFLTGEEK
jgi:hypothetical protein